MKQIAMITATPPSVNPGMLVCEATAFSLIKRAGLASDTTFFRVCTLKDRIRNLDLVAQEKIIKNCDLKIQFQVLTDLHQLENFVPVFWGDFLHMRLYLQTICRVMGRSMKDVASLLLLDGAIPCVQRSAITAFSSILFNNTEDYLDPFYGPSVKTFFRNAHSVQMRDAISAAVVSQFRKKEQTFGLDAAQLLAADACATDVLGEIFTNRALPMSRALLFFARAKHDIPCVRDFVKLLVSTLRVEARWLQWGDKLSFPLGGEGWADIPSIDDIEDASSHLHCLLSAIIKSKVVITDTYHLAVVSWALGVPAILIAGDYHSEEISGKSLDLRPRHDKRKVLYAQDGLLDFYIEPYLIAHGVKVNEIVSRLAGAVNNSDLTAAIRQSLGLRAMQAEAVTIDAIRKAGSLRV